MTDECGWLDRAAALVPHELSCAGSVLDHELQEALRDGISREAPTARTVGAATLNRLAANRGAIVVPGNDCVNVGRRAVALALALGVLGEHQSSGPKGVIGLVDRTTQRLDVDDFHTDSTPSPAPNHATLLACVEPDSEGGGATEVCWLETALALLRERCGPRAERTLREEAAWWPGDLGWVSYPVLSTTALRWHAGVLVERTAEWPSAPSPTWRLAVTSLESALKDAPRASFTLAAGQILIVDNRRAVHRRASVSADSGRKLLRLKVWIEAPDSHRATG
jgi:hypothetical protein